MTTGEQDQGTPAEAAAPPAPSPGPAWLAAALLANQWLMYLTFPRLHAEGAEPWVYYAFTAASCGLPARSVADHTALEEDGSPRVIETA